MFEEATIKAIAEIPSGGFNSPEYLAVAAGVIGLATALDIYKQRKEALLLQDNESTRIADTEQAEAAKINNRRTLIRDRAMYWGAVAFSSLCFIQLAGPMKADPKVKGEVTNVENVNTSTNTEDVMNFGGHPVSRLVATINGSVDAASVYHMPTTYILTGANALLAGSEPANFTHPNKLINQITSNITPSFRNGDSLIEGVEDATRTTSSKANDIIIESSALSADEVSQLQNIKHNLKNINPNDNISAVVVGNTTGSQAIGVETLTSPVDLSSFQEALGKNNVLSATSISQVAKDIVQLADQAHAEESNQPINYLGFNLGSLIASGLAIGAFWRRLSGLKKLMSKSK